MGFELTTLRDLVKCSNHWATETVWWARVNLWVLTGTEKKDALMWQRDAVSEFHVPVIT